MIWSSVRVKIAVFVVAIGLHAGFAATFISDFEIHMESRAGISETRSGTSFANFTQGIQTSEETEALETSMQPPPEPLPIVAAEPIAVEAPQLATTPTAIPLAIAALPPEAILQAEPEAQPVTQSPRPVQRPSPEQQKAEAPPRSGNSQQNSTAGSPDGQRTQTEARQSGANTGRSSQAGNAAATNYPGEVMRQIARVPRPQVGARGEATVRFSIASNGRLQSVSIARSSGSARLDRAALQVIQRAAPFPPPPVGARRSFSLKIEGAS
ncbi:energy transducer TonB [Pseudaestuariivita rosea]|uniref:energy transducer TonB n=1 Tax=Pseudaestuariivita rosea TaxID=2763263 RepID=UPI001ABB9A4E|nr:energy transducer TonB [Pseudaestuariivita rosea]